MLGKLLKHEFRATVRVMLPIIAALLAVAVPANFSFRYFIGDDTHKYSSMLSILSGIVIFLFIAGLTAVIIVSVVLMVQRFKQSLLGDEGYVMHTLPVSVHGLIWSKLIVSAVWFAATIIAVAIAAWGASANIAMLRDVVDILRDVVRYLREINGVQALDLIKALIKAFLLFTLGCLAMCLVFYAALAMGHGFANKKGLWSVAAFFAISFLMELVGTLLTKIYRLVWPPDSYINMLAPDHVQFINITFTQVLISLAVFSAISYFITVFNLKRRLNLE